MSSYVTCRVASYSVKHVGKISKASIIRAITDPDKMAKVEFIIDQFGHRYDGKPMTLAEAFTGGVKVIQVRYNSDRDLAMIDVAKTHAAYVKARDVVKPSGDLSPALATDARLVPERTMDVDIANARIDAGLSPTIGG